MSPSYLEYDQLLLKKAEEDPVSAFAFLLTLPEDFRRHGSRLILQRCSLRDIIPPLAEKYWTDPYDIAGVLDIAGLFPCTKKAVRTVLHQGIQRRRGKGRMPAEQYFVQSRLSRGPDHR